MKPRLLATRNGRVLGFDLKTGVPVTDWPNGGFNLGFPQADGTISSGGTNSSPPLIYKNMIVSATGGFQPGAQGGVRAFDLRTGKLLWHTRLVPEAGQPGSDSWGRDRARSAAAAPGASFPSTNAPARSSCPTDSPGPDYVGIWRPGDNKWAIRPSRSTPKPGRSSGRSRRTTTICSTGTRWRRRASPRSRATASASRWSCRRRSSDGVDLRRAHRRAHPWLRRAPGRAEPGPEREVVANAALHGRSSSAWAR